VTAICGEALLDYAELKSDEKALRLAREAAVFLAEAMPYVKAKTGGYLTYTPLDDFSIHNASISMGAYLARAAARFGEGGWAEIARGCLDFTVAAQEPDGSFDYWGDGQNVQRHVDNYHTGFVLRALLEYSELGYDSASEPLRRGWDYYQRTFVNSQGRPMTYADREVPVDIHGCAESILCGSALSLKFDDALNLAVRAARWTAQHLQNRDGSFGYGVFGHGKQSIAYTRWGESWMLRALSELCLSLAGASAPAGFTGDE
jgi:hypothetical protein